MKYFSLLNTPNQSFSTTLNRQKILFVFHSFKGNVFCDSYIGDTLICAGVVAVPNQDLFTNEFNEAIGGMMMFECIEDIDISYDKFNNTTCSFCYKEF